MVLVNYTTRELTAKLVYYGPGLCGKTTNLQYVFETLLPEDRRGKMVSLATETDRTLFFDFLPLEIGTIRGLKTRLQLYTVPGQVHYNATRKIVLKGADGIVFVADSQRSMKEANKESFRNMKDNLAEHGLDLKEVPHVIQFNKRDLADVMPVEEMFEDLNAYNAPFWEAVAVQGVGVEDTLKSVTKLVLKNLAARFAPDSAAEAEAAVPNAPTQAPVPAPAAAVPEPVAAEASPFEEPSEAPAAKSQLMTSTGELLALEFDGAGNPLGGTSAADDDGEILEVGDDALVLEEEPTRQQEAVPAPADDSPFGADDAESSEAVGSADDPFGASPSARPEAAVADEAAAALDGIELGTSLTEEEPGLASAAVAAPAEAAARFDDGETVVMASEQAPPDLEMPGLDEPIAGDTVLSPVGDLEGLATEADLPAETSSSSDFPSLDDIPDLPGMDGPPQRLAPRTGAELPPGPARIAVDAEVAALADDDAIDVPTTLNLGSVQGEVEKTLRMPIEWKDASGQSRQRTLEIQVRFKLD